MHEQVELTGSQRNCLVIDGDLAAAYVDDQPCAAQRFSGRDDVGTGQCIDAPEQCFDAGEELRNAERFA